MMWFCPCDGTLLQVRTVNATASSTGHNRHDGRTLQPQQPQQAWVCSTCPYSSTIQTPHIFITPLTRKTVDDILGGSAAWEHVDRTAATCPMCHHREAYFVQIQIRSADEPMSLFYKCCQCSHQWNDK